MRVNPRISFFFFFQSHLGMVTVGKLFGLLILWRLVKDKVWKPELGRGRGYVSLSVDSICICTYQLRSPTIVQLPSSSLSSTRHTTGLVVSTIVKLKQTMSVVWLQLDNLFYTITLSVRTQELLFVVLFLPMPGWSVFGWSQVYLFVHIQIDYHGEKQM